MSGDGLDTGPATTTNLTTTSVTFVDEGLFGSSTTARMAVAGAYSTSDELNGGDSTSFSVGAYFTKDDWTANNEHFFKQKKA